MTHKLTQSSTATANTTAPDSETPDVSMDFDVIRSINNSRDRKADEADSKLTPSIMDRYTQKIVEAFNNDDEHAKKETHVLSATFTVAGKPVKYTHIFHINHGEDNATVISVSPASRDKRLDYSVHAAREVYRTLLRRGFKAE